VRAPVAAAGDALSRYESIRAQCHTLGFDYVDNASLVEMATEERLKRLEALVARGLVNEPVAGAPLLSTEKRN
jgi:ATP-dependent DNA ligase